jgi:hypothetical protein
MENTDTQLTVTSAPPPLDIIREEPAEVIARAAQAAKALKGIVDNKAKKVIINGLQYLEFQDWQTVARFYQCTVATGEPELVEFRFSDPNEDIVGFKATGKVLDKNGEIISTATAFCMRDEPNWEDKPAFQLASMAQTRAGAKACRNSFGWVVVLAGYEATPAEEMDTIAKRNAPAQPQTATARPKAAGSQAVSTSNICPVHKIEWSEFKKGSRKWLSHAYTDSKGKKAWCNKATLEKSLSQVEMPITEAPPVKEDAELFDEEANKRFEASTYDLTDALGMSKEALVELLGQMFKKNTLISLNSTEREHLYKTLCAKLEG